MKQIRPVLIRYISPLLAFAAITGVALTLRRVFSLGLNVAILNIGVIIAAAWFAGPGPALIVDILFELLIDYVALKSGPGQLADVVIRAFSRQAVFVVLIFVVKARKKAETELSVIKDRLSADLRDMAHLHELSTRLVQHDDLQDLLREIMEAALSVTGATMANVQLFDPRSGHLKIVVHRGFDQAFLDFFNSIEKGKAACGTAIDRCERVVVEDVTQSPIFVGTEALNAVLRAGVRALQSTPLISRSGRVLGAFSTHYNVPRKPDERDLRMLDLLARQAADLIERAQAENERRKLLEREHAARAEAEAASLSKDQFLATVSHELRTPLNAMLGWARMLRGGVLDPEISRQAVETIERNAQIQARLIEDLLDVSRIVSGKMRLEVTGIDLVAVVEAAVESMKPAAEAKEIRLQVVLPRQPELIVADGNRLQQVVWNLLSNAIKFTPKGGWVSVTLVHTGAEVEIQVSDSGRGIPAEFLPYVFDRFRQGDSTLTRTQGGLGLGLAIVRHLVELHGGSVRAGSVGEDRGATFIVKLPVTASLMSAGIETASDTPENSGVFDTPAALAGLRILVVDDDPDGRTLVGTILEHCKAEVTTAASSAEAIQALDWSQPDVIVSDIEMPGEDGYYLIREIRSREAIGRAPHVPALALTAHASPDARLRALSAGYQTHMSKPFDPVELVTVIESLVTGKVATN